MTSGDHYYLEGLRHSDMVKQLDEIRGEDYDLADWDEQLKRTAHAQDTRKNWDGITVRNYPPTTARSAPQSETIPNEHEFLPGMSTQEMYPIEHDDHNISRQLVEHVDRLSRMAARRPTADYHVRVRPRGGTAGWSADLVHTPTNKKVGELDWRKDDGYVDNLEVEVGHRHMTNYFTTQAWNHARTKGQLGPAASDMLSPFSEKILKKYNPDSADFKKFQKEKDAQCPSCRNNPGLAVLTPHPTNGGRHVEYSVPELHVDTVPNTESKNLDYRTDAEHRFDLNGVTDQTQIRNPETGKTHTWFHLEVRCPNCHGSGLSLHGQVYY